MDMSTIGRPLEDFLKRCPQCNCEYNLLPYGGPNGTYLVIYSSCKHAVCWNCRNKSPETCPVCLKSNQSARSFPFFKLTNLLCTAEFRVLTKEDQEKIVHERTRYEDKIKEMEMEKKAATELKKEDQETIELEKTRYEDKIKELQMENNRAMEQFATEKNRLEMELETEKIKTKTKHEKVKEEDQEKMKLFEDKIEELEMEKKAATELKEQFATEKNRLEMELETGKIKTKTENEKVKEEDQDKMKLLEDKIKELEMEKKAATELKKVSFTCSECDFPVAEYRSHICIDCGLSSGFLTKEDQNLRLNADTQQLEKENLMCVGCAIEGFHAGHRTVNYQPLKLKPISIEKKKAKDSELAEKRDTVVNSQTMITVARLLQTARVELSKLSEETVNAVTWDEFNSTWNSADIELSRAHSITENFLNVADDTEKSLEKVVAGLGAIRTGCKVVAKNSGKGDISEGANRDEIKTDCSASVITDASEWEALSDFSGKSDQKGEI